ncbi:MAG: hypothetical protein ACE5F1_18440 [Planctomycetota bacterium]
MQSRVGTPVLLVLLLAALPIGLALGVQLSSGDMPREQKAGEQEAGNGVEPGSGPGTPGRRSGPAEKLSVPGRSSGTRPSRPKKPQGIGRRGSPPRNAARFPDGTWLPALNGVENAPPFQGWTGRYSPVVRIARGELDWYVHANGSRSTVQMVKFEAKGRTWYSPQWVVARPRKTLPIKLPEDERRKR